MSSRINPKRATPRRRAAPQWTAAEWKDARVQMFFRSGGRCEHCQKPLDGRMEVHHRIRRRDGGDRFSNLLALLPECHRWITEHPETAREFGWILLVGSDPMACPVWISERRWLLDDFGGRRPEP